MFVCINCADNWFAHFVRSWGKCEGCGTEGQCVDEIVKAENENSLLR